jgi:hypothetical protein
MHNSKLMGKVPNSYVHRYKILVDGFKANRLKQCTTKHEGNLDTHTHTHVHTRIHAHTRARARTHTLKEALAHFSFMRTLLQAIRCKTCWEITISRKLTAI